MILIDFIFNVFDIIRAKVANIFVYAYFLSIVLSFLYLR